MLHKHRDPPQKLSLLSVSYKHSLSVSVQELSALAARISTPTHCLCGLLQPSIKRLEVAQVVRGLNHLQLPWGGGGRCYWSGGEQWGMGDVLGGWVSEREWVGVGG